MEIWVIEASFECIKKSQKCVREKDIDTIPE
jgi:hypothetical protein